MNALLSAVICKLFNVKNPEELLLKIVENLFKMLAPMIEKQLQAWLPTIVKTVAVALAQSAGQLFVNVENKVTDIIPGNLDDKILDSLTKSVFDELHKVLGI